MSKTLVLPFFTIVVGQVLYHVVMRWLPREVSPLLVVGLAYGIASMASFLLWLALPSEPGLSAASLSATLPWSVAIAAGVFLVEVGYIFAYRSGLPLSFGALVVFAVTTVVLVPLATIAFREQVDGHQIVGVMLVLAGAWFILGHVGGQ